MFFRQSLKKIQAPHPGLHPRLAGRGRGDDGGSRRNFSRRIEIFMVLIRASHQVVQVSKCYLLTIIGGFRQYVNYAVLNINTLKCA